MSAGDEELSKDLGPLAALTIGVGTMIGAGIFVLPGTAIERAGWHAVLSFILGGGIALFTALSASELGTAMPRSGGAYYYVNQALGPLFGSIAGWSNWLGLAFASAFYMVGFGEYIRAILGLSGPIVLGSVAVPPVKLIALLGAALFVGVNYIGAKETGRLQNGIVIVLVAILAVFTVSGALRAEPAHLPVGKGFNPLLTTTGLIFVSYLGFVQITSVGEEIKNPGKNLPRAVIGSVLLVTVIYALVLITMAASVEQGFIAEQQLAGNIAVVEVGRLLLGPIGAIALLFGGLLATASSANASILASSRINFAMGRDRIVSPQLNEVHPRFHTPYRAIAITGGFILSFIIAGNVELLATLGSVLHLIIYGLLNIALIVMREADVADYDPVYRVPFYPVTPLIGALVSFALIVYISPIVIAFSGVLVGGAIAWYLLYAKSRTSVEGALSKFIFTRRDEMPDAVLSTAASVQPDGGTFRVMVPLANPEHEENLIRLASSIAAQHNGTVHAVHIVTVPDQTSLEYAANHLDQIEENYHGILDAAEQDANELGVALESHTIVSHRSFEEIFDAARTHRADLVVMGWGGDAHGSPGRVETAIDDLVMDLPCDFLVFNDEGFDPERILIPTAGGIDSELAAEIAAALQREHGSEITLLHVSDDVATGEAFLEQWATDQGLEDADRRVESGDIGDAITRAAADATLVIVGASERGLLTRLVRGSPVLGLIDDVDCSAILAQRAYRRGFLARLIGR
jgi:amino acid transporter/nucleotide-binding universal stress UspA family protein